MSTTLRLLCVCSTVAVTFPASGLHPYMEVVLRLLAIVLMVFTLAALAAPAGYGRAVSSAVASAYSPESSGATNGCDGSRLHDGDLTVATFLVPCGARIRVCVAGRCVVARRKDSGPYVHGRQLDLNLGVVRALGFRSCQVFGVRRVGWSRP